MPESSTASLATAKRVARPKIVLVGPPLSAIGGVTEHLKQLLDSKLAEEFSLLYFEAGSPHDETLWQKLWRLISRPVAFFLYLCRHKPAIVHINTGLDSKAFWRDLTFLAAAKLLQQKIVFQMHGGSLPEEFFSGRKLLTALLRYVLNWPSAIVLLSHAELTAYRRFVPGQRLEVVPNAISVEPFITRPLDREKHGPLHLIYVGRLVENKGVFTDLEALKLLISEGRDMSLTFVGSGPDEVRLREKAFELGLQERVRFTGAVFGEDKNALWRNADVFVFPTYHQEGLPYALLEAMAAGVAPVTTPVGAIPEVMQDGVHGLFVPDRDPDALACAIAKLDDDRALLLSFARAARRRVVERYAVTRLVEDLSRIYADLLEG